MAKIKLGKRSIKSILLTILSIMLCVGLVFGIGAAVIKNEEETKKTISSYSFDYGNLSSDGIFVEDKAAIYTKEAISCKGLEVELKFENNIEYNIFFYQEDGSFLSATGFSRKSYTEDIPEGARTCRIVIRPIDDDSIAFYEIQTYAKQLTIKVDKNQRFEEVETETHQESTVEETN